MRIFKSNVTYSSHFCNKQSHGIKIFSHFWVDNYISFVYHMVIPQMGNQKGRGRSDLINTNLLKGKILSAGFTQQTLAPLVKMSVNSLNAKINGRKVFDTDEVERICDILNITDPVEKCHIFLS